MEWIITDLYNDIQIDEANDRCLLIYEVPIEHAADGIYSVSMPKNMITDFAATYGYDLDDPADVDDLWEHLIHLPYMMETARREGRAHEVAVNPYEMTAQAARKLAKDQVAEAKQRGRITERPTPASTATHSASAAEVSGILDIARRDMLGRADAAAARSLAAEKQRTRQQTQERMFDMALRMNASRS